MHLIWLFQHRSIPPYPKNNFWKWQTFADSRRPPTREWNQRGSMLNARRYPWYSFVYLPRSLGNLLCLCQTLCWRQAGNGYSGEESFGQATEAKSRIPIDHQSYADAENFMVIAHYIITGPGAHSLGISLLRGCLLPKLFVLFLCVCLASVLRSNTWLFAVNRSRRIHCSEWVDKTSVRVSPVFPDVLWVRAGLYKGVAVSILWYAFWRVEEVPNTYLQACKEG